MKCFNEPIPEGKLAIFDSILKACGGRYLSNPQKSIDGWRVSYEYEDIESANEHGRRWRRATTDIIEKRRKTFWGKIKSFFNRKR
jgi:hypothetical protein